MAIKGRRLRPAPFFVATKDCGPMFYIDHVRSDPKEIPMGISYQTRNRLRRKVHTAPLTAPVSAPASEPTPPIADRRIPWWPIAAAVAAASTAFAFLYRG
jgi:hypothetical protein